MSLFNNIYNLDIENRNKRILRELSVNGEEIPTEDDVDDNFDDISPTEDDQEAAQDNPENANDNVNEEPTQEETPEEGEDNPPDDEGETNFDIPDEETADDVTPTAEEPQDDAVPENTPDDATNPPTEDDAATTADVQQLNTDDTATEDVEDDFTVGDETDDAGGNQYDQDDINTDNDTAGDNTNDGMDDGAAPAEGDQETGDTGGDTDAGGDFDLDGDMGGEEGADDGTGDPNADQGQDTGGDTMGAQGDPSDNIADQEQQEAEKQLYDTLTEEQKQLRVLRLKKSYKQLFNQSENILNAINGITKTQENIDTLRRVIEALSKIKKLLIQYTSTNFDMNTYIENYSNYIKFLAVFRTISKVMDELTNSDNKG